MKMKRIFMAGLALLATLAVNAEEKQTSPYTGITIEQAAGRSDLFLYNVESGLWLQENNRRKGSWNTRGELDKYGRNFSITTTDGGYYLNGRLGQASMNPDNFYLDTPTHGVFTFNSITKEGVSNAYQIKTGDKWVHAMPETDATSFGLIINNVEARATWQIVTLEERLTYLQQNASETNPLDATFLILANNLVENDEYINVWKQEMNGGNSDWNRPDDGNNGYRCLRAHGFWNSITSKYYQTITDVPDGIYEFYCTGFYRDGNRDQCQDRRAAGTETIRGFMFINEDRAPLKSILDGAQSTQVSGFKYNYSGQDYGYIPDGGDDVARCFVDYPDAYLNDPVRATVVGGTITLGIDKTNYTGGGDWVFFTRFRLNYLGPIDISEYTDALNAAITAAENFNGNTTDILASNLADALSAARALLSSTDTGAMATATSNLNNALTAARNVDDTLLEKTIPLAKAEGIDTSAAEDFIVNGTDNNQNNSLLASLRNQRKIKANSYFNAETIESLVGSEPQDGESYYLLNVGTGMFFACNSDWGTHMALDSKGFLVKLIADGETNGLTNYHVSGKESVGWDGFNWGEEYFDKNGESKWHFVPVEGKTNVYNFAIFDNHDWHILYDPNNLKTDGDSYFNVLKKLNASYDSYKNNPYAQWILLTPQQRTDLLAQATASNPIDATHFIENPNFNKSKVSGSDDTKYGWTGLGTIGSFGRYADYVAEFFETTGDVKTTLTGLPAGQYKVAVNGYYREKSFENDIEMYNNGADHYSDHAKLVAYTDADNRVEANFMHVSVEHGKVPGIGTAWAQLGGDELPFYMEHAAQYFETGCYRLTTDVISVGEDGTLTIGIEKPESTGNDANWIVFDNFQLICLGTDLVLDETKSDNTDKITQTGGATKTIRLTRPLVKNTYNTICLPFEVAREEITPIFGDGTVLAKFVSYDAEKGNYSFESATSIEAGVAYIIKPTADAPATYVFDDRSSAPVFSTDDYFKGAYDPQNVAVGDKLVATGDKLKTVTTAGQIKGFRAYFPAVQGNAAKECTFSIDGESTGIIGIDGEVIETTGNVYDLQGRKVSKPQRGVYIVNGKKVVMK